MKLLARRRYLARRGTFASGQELQIPMNWRQSSSVVLRDTLYMKKKSKFKMLCAYKLLLMDRSSAAPRRVAKETSLPKHVLQMIAYCAYTYLNPMSSCIYMVYKLIFTSGYILQLPTKKTMVSLSRTYLIKFHNQLLYGTVGRRKIKPSYVGSRSKRPDVDVSVLSPPTWVVEANIWTQI